MRSNASFGPFVAAVFMAILTVGCANIKIESGGTEDRTENNRDRASDIRAEFAEQLNSTTPVGQVNYLADYAEFVGGNTVDYGETMVRQWKEGEDGRSEVITGEEMRGLIDRSIASERPILKAWEDNIEYAYRVIQTDGFFTSDMIELLKQLLDAYYELNSAVMFPMGTVDDYEYNIDDRRRDFEMIVSELRRKAGQY